MILSKLTILLIIVQYSGMQSSQIRVAGLFLRRKSGQEFHTYINILNYNPNHYEVLLRRWPSEPFLLHLGAFSGPVIDGEDPQDTLLRESQSWTINLASKKIPCVIHQFLVSMFIILCWQCIL